MPINMDTLASQVQLFLQDHPMMNTITRKSEFTPGLIKLAILMMIDHFNHINWRSCYTKESFPDAALDIQVYGTLYHLMSSMASLNTRNNLPYNDAGLSVAQFAKSGEYLGLANQFKQHFETQALALKYQMNLEMGWGGVPSEYSYFGGFANMNGNST